MITTLNYPQREDPIKYYVTRMVNEVTHFSETTAVDDVTDYAWEMLNNKAMQYYCLFYLTNDERIHPYWEYVYIRKQNKIQQDLQQFLEQKQNQRLTTQLALNAGLLNIPAVLFETTTKHSYNIYTINYWLNNPLWSQEMSVAAKLSKSITWREHDYCSGSARDYADMVKNLATKCMWYQGCSLKRVIEMQSNKLRHFILAHPGEVKTLLQVMNATVESK